MSGVQPEVHLQEDTEAAYSLEACHGTPAQVPALLVFSTYQKPPENPREDYAHSSKSEAI